MMSIALSTALLVVAAHAAVVPINSSSVSVKQSGQDYSYSVHENRGLAIDTIPIIPQRFPLVRTQQVVPNSVVTSVVSKEHGPKDETQHSQHSQIQVRTALAPAHDGSYTLPVVPLNYGYIPSGYQYAITYPYHVPYPYGIIGTV